MIEKPSIIVVSAGRTGTKFFSKFFDETISNIDAFHIPDYTPKIASWGEWESVLKNFGFFNLTVRKVLGRFGLRVLSTMALNNKDVYMDFYKQRNNFVKQLPNPYYAEANPGYFGLIKYINRLYNNVRILFIIRNGYDWVTSHMNWGRWYNSNMLIEEKLHHRISPSKNISPELRNDWNKFDRFEKLCWAWNAINSVIYSDIEGLSNSSIFRFEDIFYGPERFQSLLKMYSFSTEHIENSDKKYDSIRERLLDKKVNENKANIFQGSEAWTAQMYKKFDRHCSELMEKFDYPIKSL